jgi:hypothetical protein
VAKVSDVFPGAKFGMLTVLKMTGSKIMSGKTRKYCDCFCACGKVVSVRVENLGRAKGIESCGCARQSMIGRWGEKAVGLSKTKLYATWVHMKQRCYNPKSKAYRNYGGRGIKVCTEWISNFTAFYHWALISGYSDNLTIDRIDNDEDYSPDNCQWVTLQEQQAVGKKRVSSRYRFIEYGGLCLSMKGWSLRLCNNEALVCQRLKRGWNLIKAITTPVNKNHQHFGGRASVRQK